MSALLRLLRRLIPQRSPLRLLWHKSKGLTAAAMYGFPARKLTVIGITGTDGKTTTVGMTAHILSLNGVRVGALSTAFFSVNGIVTWNVTQKTSPSPFLIQKFLWRIRREGCTHAVLECSSHGLVQGRLLYTWPRVAAITNTAMEHLDYHGTMDQYRRDKGILFRLLRGNGTKVLNADDGSLPLYREIPSARTLLFSPKEDLKDIRGDVTSSTATARIGDHNYLLRVPLPGSFNLENALCAILCAKAVGVLPEQSIRALERFTGVPGRMEGINAGQSFSVYVDFTVTPQAFEKTLTAARHMIAPDKRILVLTGSCGDRMREKRPIIAHICSELADVVVITDDESYTEEPKSVIEEVWAGIDPSKADAHKIFDRREAIQFIFSKANPGDLVLLCGLGSYPSRMTPKGPIPWNEQKIAKELLREFAR